MSPAVRAWIFGILGWVATGFVVYAPLPWPIKLGFWIVLVNATSDLGGRWFGYIGVLLGLLGFLNPTDAWWQLYPMMFFILWAFMLLKHTLHVYGVIVGLAGVLGMFAVLKIAVPLLDPTLRLFLGQPFTMALLVGFLVACILHMVVHFSNLTGQQSQAKGA